VVGVGSRVSVSAEGWLGCAVLGLHRLVVVWEGGGGETLYVGYVALGASGVV